MKDSEGLAGIFTPTQHMLLTGSGVPISSTDRLVQSNIGDFIREIGDHANRNCLSPVHTSL